MSSSYSSLFDAVRAGNLEAIEQFVLKNPEQIDAAEDKGLNSFNQASKCGFSPILYGLIPRDSKATDSDGWTPMHEAAMNGHTEVIEALVRLGSKALDARDCHGWTPMHVAAWHAHAKVIELLMRLGSTALNSPGNVTVIAALVRLGNNATISDSTTGSSSQKELGARQVACLEVLQPSTE